MANVAKYEGVVHEGGSALPEVLTSFFESKGGHSLILKGSAGTGKTTLALQMVEVMSRTQQTRYISSRVSDASLYSQFPWLAAKNRQRDILNAARAFLNVFHPRSRKPQVQATLPGAMLEASAVLLAVLNRGRGEESAMARAELRKLEGQVESGEIDDGAEASSGSGRISGDSITFDIGSDLPEIEEAYDFVEAAHPGKSLVVFDSIDALAEKYGISQTRLVNTIQKDVVEGGGANVVYVLETHGPTMLDYLGDGVLSLSAGEHAGRMVRTMRIEKMRGRPVPHPNLNYSLLGGRIRVFEPTRFGSAPRRSAGIWEPVPDPDAERVSFGDESLDRLIGGLARGSINILEIGAGVPNEVVSMLSAMLAANFVRQGRGVAHLPESRGNASSARDSFCRYMTEAEFLEGVRVFEMNLVGGGERMGNVLLIEGTDLENDFRWDNIEYNLQETAKPTLSLMALDMLERIYGPTAMDSMNAHLMSVRLTGSVFVGTTSGGRAADTLSAASNVHLKLERTGPNVVIYGEKPYTTLHQIVYEDCAGIPRLKFVPVM